MSDPKSTFDLIFSVLVLSRVLTSLTYKILRESRSGCWESTRSKTSFSI